VSLIINVMVSLSNHDLIKDKIILVTLRQAQDDNIINVMVSPIINVMVSLSNHDLVRDEIT
jgi:hypothetical protein